MPVLLRNWPLVKNFRLPLNLTPASQSLAEPLRKPLENRLENPTRNPTRDNLHLNNGK